MARRQRVSTVIGNREGAPLRFDTQREALALRNRQFGGARRASINVADTEVGTGRGLGFQVSFAFTPQELADINSVPKLRQQLNRIVRNTGARLLDRVKTVSAPTRVTGLFKDSWRIKSDIIGSVDAGGVKLRLEVSNDAPYALYVHRKGTPKEKTVVNTYVKPLVQRAIDELLDDLTGSSGVLPRALRGRILRPLAKLA